MNKHYLIIDLEATCCDKGSFPRGEMEVIEIGAVIQDAATLAIIDEFSTFVKPIRHPRLTGFCTRLTGIQQTDVDLAPEYPEATSVFSNWLKTYADYVFCSWGAYDKHQLEQDSLFHNISMPVQASHLNLKVRFSEAHGLNMRKLLSMEKALRYCDLPHIGTLHRAIDDARNISRLMPFIIGSLPPR